MIRCTPHHSPVWPKRAPLGALVVALPALWLVAPSAAWAEKITTIEVIDNSKTTDDTVILIANIKIGDRFTPDITERIKLDLVNSGLFKEVEVIYGPDPDPQKRGILLTITAVDKHSWAVAPTYYNQPTNQGGGIGFGENNLFGKNKKLLLYGQVATGDSFFIGAYVDPSIAGTRFKWQADVYLKKERTIEYSKPLTHRDESLPVRHSKLTYLNTGVRGGVNLWRGAALDVRLRGALVSYSGVVLDPSASVEQVTGDPTSDPNNLPAPGVDGTDVSTEIIFDYDRRANWYGISQGNRYTASLEYALPQLGSDFEYWYATLRYQRAKRYFTQHNFIVRGTLGYGRDLPFQQEYAAGGTAQRGYKNDQFRGDVLVNANFEYSVPLFTIKGFSLRALGFYDSSYVTFRDVQATDTFRTYLPTMGEASAAAPFKNSIGVGTRIYVRQIVLPLLGLDLGYGLERGDIELYLAIGLTDF